jgi:hypothetical protein
MKFILEEITNQSRIIRIPWFKNLEYDCFLSNLGSIFRVQSPVLFFVPLPLNFSVFAVFDCVLYQLPPNLVELRR